MLNDAALDQLFREARSYGWLSGRAPGNVLYHLSQKSIPSGVDPIVSIVASYLTAIALSIVFFSLASITANTTVALVLLPTGVLLFRERVTPANAIGLVLVTR